MDRRINRINEAFMAADRIINAIECTGIDLSNPDGFFQYSEYLPSNIQFDSGVTRLVFWDTDYCDYVIKIALNQKYEKYCQHEVEVYAAAVDEGVSDSFAWCTCYSEPVEEEEVYVPGIYVMEYLDCNEEAVSDSAWSYGYKKYCEERGIDGSDWEATDDYNEWRWDEGEETVLDYMESMMSTEYLKTFEVFMRKWWINDIHEANVSFANDGRLVIIDYAGWGW